tara:strand:+ start:59847 stop:61913 length:2067 start_codon:yes stop_codon:yes gene_type:complete
MAKKIQLDFIIAISTFFLLVSLILFLYVTSINKHYAVIEEDVYHSGKLISQEFNNIVQLDVSKLENIKNRLEFTNGSYFKNWEYDANLLLNEDPSFKFIEWIDSLMIIRKISPLKGNEQAINLDISKIEYRRDEWIKHSKNGKTNITSWAKLTQSGYAFLVDVPVYFDDSFQGTITAGMNFNNDFDRLINHLENQYAVELYDDQNTLFYQKNNQIKFKTNRDIVYTNNIQVDAEATKTWHLNIYLSEKSFLAESRIITDIALVVGLFLATVVSLLIYFYIRARKGTRQALESNLSLTRLNQQINKEKDRANKASQAKTDFLSNMSHEIRTPLHAIIGFIELLKDGKLSNTHKEYIDFMDKSSNNLLDLINDILEIDKIESGKVQLDEVVFNPSKKIKELVDVNQFLFLKKNLYLRTNFENTLDLTVRGDSNKLLQIVNNILKNALKFTKRGGVTMTYSETVIKDKLKLVISIEDTGIGIPKDQLQTIFNRFTQIENSIKKQHEGSGLGLAIAKNLVSILGGEISVESENQIGTKFTISFVFDIVENKTAVTESKQTLNTDDINVLIVDDNNLNIIVLKKFLEDLNIKSDIAENGKVALEKIEDKKYQLIFMDIHMPEMDGWETTRIIRQTDRDVIILGLSANVSTEAINKAIENGMNNYLSKPFKKEHLRKLLQFHFNSDGEQTPQSI